jgi:uncharacterized membrane-anchored protein
MKIYKWWLIGANLLILLVFFNLSVVKKEKLLSEGKLVLLELAPVDPRSLMQGDYMQLRYAISDNLFNLKIPKRGFCVVKLDSIGVGKKIRFQRTKKPLNKHELLIEYTYSNWNMNIGAESYFFEEGQAKKYEKAKYGGIKIDQNGNSLLIGLFDQKLRLIK